MNFPVHKEDPDELNEISEMTDNQLHTEMFMGETITNYVNEQIGSRNDLQ